MEEYLGNILDYYQKMYDIIDDYQEMIEGLSKNLRFITDQQNQ